MKESLIEAVLKQIVTDVKNKDLTAIEELLKAVPEQDLKNFISEDN